MSLENIHNVYFIGIGGIGMSALARWFKTNGYGVGGYDRTPTSLTEQLEEEGMDIHFEDDITRIAEEFKNLHNTLVVYTPAVPNDLNELAYFTNNGFSVKKRSEVLGMITENFFTIAVAGTHGKTTTSSMIAHLLKSAGKNCFAFLGGITQNYNTNLLLGDPSLGEQLMVVEADEYDRSFLTLSPDIAVINSMDADHLDIYGAHEEVEKSFNEFVRNLKPVGKLIYKGGLPVAAPLPGQTFFCFGSEVCAYRAANIHIENEEFVFDIETTFEIVKNVRIQVPGFHNVQNALAAFAVTRQLGIPASKIKEGLSSFKGVKRRFEYIINRKDFVYIDDYAHHPEEIKAFLSSVKAIYPDKKITAVFQPHLFSRTRDFMDGFAKSLSMADKLILMEIYPARELPIEGITSTVLLDKVTSKEKILASKGNLLKEISETKTDVLVTIGAGDIDKFVKPIKEIYS